MDVRGLIVVGPTAAPNAIQVPVHTEVSVRDRNGQSVRQGSVEEPKPLIEAQFSKRLDEDTLTPDTFYVTDGENTFDGTIGYDSVTAQASITLDDALASGTEYTVVVDGVTSLDGDVMSTEWTFSTIDSVFRLSASDRYGTAVTICQETFDNADVVLLATVRLPRRTCCCGSCGLLCRAAASHAADRSAHGRAR